MQETTKSKNQARVMEINNSFNLKGRVEDMKLYYLSATNYYHSLDNSYIIHGSSRKPNKCNGFYAPIIVFLLASDRIVLYSSHHCSYNKQTYKSSIKNAITGTMQEKIFPSLKFDVVNGM